MHRLRINLTGFFMSGRSIDRTVLDRANRSFEESNALGTVASFASRCDFLTADAIRGEAVLAKRSVGGKDDSFITTRTNFPSDLRWCFGRCQFVRPLYRGSQSFAASMIDPPCKCIAATKSRNATNPTNSKSNPRNGPRNQIGDRG